jgi:hypothetical protein
MKKGWTLYVILAIALAGTIFSDGIEYGRTIYDGELSDSGHSWAGYAKQCDGNQLDLRFNLKNLTGGVQANLNLNDSNRYAVGVTNLENGSLATYLFRQEKGNVEHFPGKMINYDPSATYQIEISSGKGEVQVFMMGIQDNETVKVIDYFDTDPLPAGAIDFESLENSSVNLREVAINCKIPLDEEPPNLGVGYFKPPT